MLVSTKGRYALRVMLDLARHQREGNIALRSIADREHISEKYLESILKLLVSKNFVVGVRGKGGGYRLTRLPEDYTVHEILLAGEGTLSPVSCLDEHEACEVHDSCRVMTMWRELDSVIVEYLESVTLADLLGTGDPGDNYVI